MNLTARAQAFQGKRVKVRAGLGIVRMSPEFHIVRRTTEGEVGRIVSVTDAGFNGLQFTVVLADGNRVNAYERSDLR